MVLPLAHKVHRFSDRTRRNVRIVRFDHSRILALSKMIPSSLVHRTRVFLPLTFDESPDVYTRRYTHARRELVAFLRASLHYRMAASPRKLRPRSTLVHHYRLPRRAHPTSTFSLSTIFIIYSPLCPFTDEEEKNGRRENKPRHAHPYWVGGSKQAAVRVDNVVVVIENLNRSHATRRLLLNVFLVRDWLVFDCMAALVLFMFLCRTYYHVLYTVRYCRMSTSSYCNRCFACSMYLKSAYLKFHVKRK